jgi:hypothetical protein
MDKNTKEYKCLQCNKEYSGYQSLWIHNKKFHEEKNIPEQEKNIICKFCGKDFAFTQSKWRHEKNCKKKQENNNLLENAMIKISELEKKIDKLENKKSVTKNFTKNNNNGTINNVNINIVAPGNEKNDLTIEEIKSIFEKQLTSVIRYIELTNFNKDRPTNHSFCVTNRDGKHLLSYNTDTATVENNKKKYFYASVLSKAILKMEAIFYTNKKVLNKQFSKEQLDQIIDSIERLREICEKDYDSKILKSLYDELNLLCYNSRKTVLNTWENKKPEQNGDNEDNEDNEDYKDIFVPMKGFIEMYSNDVLNDSSEEESDSESEMEQVVPVQLKNIKKVNNNTGIEI